MNISIKELKNQKETIHRNFLAELQLNYRHYKENEEQEFEEEDYYYKFLLFSIYRAIESMLRLFTEERKALSKNKEFYNVLFDDLKSCFISREKLKLVLDDFLAYKVTYQDVYNLLTSCDIIKNTSSIKDISDIKPVRKAKEDNVYNEIFLQLYIECTKNRNKLMHSNVSDIDLTASSIRKAFIIYSYFNLLFEQL